MILFISSVVALPKVDPDENYDLREHGFQIVVIYLLIGFFALNYRETIGA